MYKFQLINKLRLDFSLIEKNGKGEISFNRRVEFYGGQLSPNFRGGDFHTDEEKVAELLRKHPWLDKEFVEIKLPGAKKAVAKVEPTEPVKPAEPTEPVNPVEPVEPSEPAEPTEPVEPVESTEPVEPAEPVASAEPTEPVEQGITEFPEITTNQMAVAKLRELDSSIKTADVRNKANILAAAQNLNISFPNL